MELLNKIPDQLRSKYNFARLRILMEFWSCFYEASKYGEELLGIGPEKLFFEPEAKLAVQHAEECLEAAGACLAESRAKD